MLKQEIQANDCWHNSNNNCNHLSDGVRPTYNSTCQKCGAIYRHGQWQWPDNFLLNYDKKECPTCKRIRMKRPAGIIVLSGKFVQRYRSKILRFVYQQIENRESESPIKRLIQYEQLGDKVIIMSFTDKMSPLEIGLSIVQKFNGKLKVYHNDVKELVQVRW